MSSSCGSFTVFELVLSLCCNTEGVYVRKLGLELWFVTDITKHKTPSNQEGGVVSARFMCQTEVTRLPGFWLVPPY